MTESFEHLAEPAREVRGGWEPEPPNDFPAWEDPELQPSVSPPQKSLGLKEEKLGNKLDTLVRSCLNAMGIFNTDSQWGERYSRVAEMIPEANVNNSVPSDCREWLGYYLSIDGVKANRVYQVLLDASPIIPENANLAKGCMQFVGQSPVETEEKVAKAIPVILHLLNKPNPSKLTAIKEMRQLAGVGLKEAKDMVEWLAGKCKMTEVQPIAAMCVERFMFGKNFNPAEVEKLVALAIPRIYSLLDSGKKIHAIKELRDQAKIGLKEAKDMVEYFEELRSR